MNRYVYTYLTEMQFLYTGGSCPLMNPTHFSSCTTSNANPFTARFSFRRTDNMQEFFSIANIEVLNTFVVNNNGGADCIPEEFDVKGPTGFIAQEIVVTTNCSSTNIEGIPLNFVLGGLDFVGFTCQGNSSLPFNCFSTASIAACAENTGMNMLELTEYVLDVNDVSTDLLNGAQVSLDNGEAYCAEEDIGISKCEQSPTTFEVCSNVTAEAEESNATCLDKEALQFTIE